ncbi:hypothetical protein KCM76_23010 [Zooshikella marina]|uniref:Gp49 family protein n=1 Tax=Zooshikella ganghwensis TaxID=202772 RepID=UPI001BAE8E12|nr:Gp49 family protein [Zooshikella ganghwensis]MBU2708883.1 hypothetical protein [Zooshikella ganghwensis]
MAINRDEILEEVMETVEFLTRGVLTLCVLKTKNDYYIVGQSACVNPKDYDQELGESLAFDHAAKQLIEKYSFYVSQTGVVDEH